MSFFKIFQILFIVDSTFLIFIPEYLNNSWWCFSSSFSTFEDRRRVSLKSCSILFKTHGYSLMPSSHNCFRLSEFLSLIRSNSRIFSVWLFGVHQFSFIHSQLSVIILQSYRCIVQVFLISSWSLRSHGSKFTQVLMRMLSHSSHLIQLAQSLF